MADPVTSLPTVAAGEAGKYLAKSKSAATGPAANKYAFGFDLSLGFDKWVTFDFGINATFDPIESFGEAGVDSYKKEPSRYQIWRSLI